MATTASAALELHITRRAIVLTGDSIEPLLVPKIFRHFITIYFYDLIKFVLNAPKIILAMKSATMKRVGNLNLSKSNLAAPLRDVPMVKREMRLDQMSDLIIYKNEFFVCLTPF